MEERQPTVNVSNTKPSVEPPPSQKQYMNEEEYQWLEDVKMSANKMLTDNDISKIAALQGKAYSPFTFERHPDENTHQYLTQHKISDYKNKHPESPPYH